MRQDEGTLLSLISGKPRVSERGGIGEKYEIKINNNNMIGLIYIMSAFLLLLNCLKMVLNTDQCQVEL